MLASSQLELISDKTTGTQLQQNALKLTCCVSEPSRKFNLLSVAGVEREAEVWPSGHLVDHTTWGRKRSTVNCTQQLQMRDFSIWEEQNPRRQIMPTSPQLVFQANQEQYSDILNCLGTSSDVAAATLGIWKEKSSLGKGLREREKKQREEIMPFPPTLNIHVF